MARHLLFFGKLFNLPVLFRFLLCGLDVICKQSPACGFKKKSFAPRTSRKPHVKDLFLSTFEPRDDFLGRGDEAECPREIIGCAKRENAQWNAAIDKPASDLCSCAIPTGCQYEVAGLVESFLETAFFGGLISGVMPGLRERRHQLLLTVSGITSLGIVQDRKSTRLN